MSDELLAYYERELSFLRQAGAEFAAKYPKIAGRLQLEADKRDETEDPHVERLLQGFAFLTARVHRKIDDEFPEITDALLGMLYPHYLAPLPSMAIAQFVLNPHQGKLTKGYPLAPGTMLNSQPVDGVPCRFRTCYPVTLWPLEVDAAQFAEPDRLAPSQAVAMLTLRLRCLGGVTLTDLDLERLRFFLHGESSLVHALYELLFTAVCQVQVKAREAPHRGEPLVLSSRSLRPVGFGSDEGILPYTPRSFLGYRLLQEYFTFAQKFLFFDLCEFDRACRAGFRDGIEIRIFLDRAPRLAQPIHAGVFRLGCTPIVNVFEQIAEPIRVSHTQTEYRVIPPQTEYHVIPDRRRQHAMEVYSVNTVTCVSAQQREPRLIQPFYSLRHTANQEPQQAYWYTSRRPSQRQGDAGTEVYLTLVDLHFQPTLPAADTLTMHITSTNRDLPGKLPFGGDQGGLFVEGSAPLTPIRCLTQPTETLRPPLQGGARWRLISHLSLNYLSICAGGREALQEILALYNFTDSTVIRQQIAGITQVTSRQAIARPASMPWNGFCRGMEVTIEFDESKYVGSGVFLFASVLETFLGLYTSLNSFTQLTTTTQQREGHLKRWPPRTGEQILL